MARVPDYRDGRDKPGHTTGEPSGTSGAGIARRFQLTGAIDAFNEQRLLIGVDGSAGRRVRAHERRMWDRDAPVLKIACGILQTASHRGILLRESRRRKEVQ
jgi:hypothetical protein